MKKIIIVAITAWFGISCNGPVPEASIGTLPEPGIWRASIMLNDSIEVPFNFTLIGVDSNLSMIVHNGEEAIEIKDLEWKGDSLKIQMPVFANYLIVKPEAQEMKGFFIGPDKGYKLALNAEYGDSNRFLGESANCCDINYKWAVEFGPNDDVRDPAIAYFKQNGQHLEATFLTETGDYRFLEGVLTGTKLQLSTFDGAHLFYFDAELRNGQIMDGRFYSGATFMDTWKAYRDDDFELRNPDSLTFLKEGYDAFDFSFEDLNGEVVSLSDKRFEGKPVVVQILGSWCPNCMDETRYLAEVYDQYSKDDLEIVGLTFERTKDKATAIKRAKKMVNDMGIPYPMLLGGATREDKAAELLPALNHVMSYPTAIYLRRDHSIRKIHTGFAGPGTPVYQKYIEENKVVLDELVSEHSADHP